MPPSTLSRKESTRKSSRGCTSSRKSLPRREHTETKSKEPLSEKSTGTFGIPNPKSPTRTLDSYFGNYNVSTPVDPEEVPTRRRWRVSLKEFSSSALHHRFEEHIRKAQDAFLAGETAVAETHASKALAIRPTAHLFAFMAVLAESKGQFDRASDFRLLQAFLAKDRVLWEELLHEFLSQQLYFKSAMVLQRLSALEKRDRQRYRTLQIQLADLYIGLGEIRRAVNVLVPLWESSRCHDFGVFSMLSGLYFQLGKWNALESLISSSLRYFLRVEEGVRTPAGEEKETGQQEVDGMKHTGEHSVLLEHEGGTSGGRSCLLESSLPSGSTSSEGVEGPSPPFSSCTHAKKRRRRIRFMDREEGEGEDEEELAERGSDGEEETEQRMELYHSSDASDPLMPLGGRGKSGKASSCTIFNGKNYYTISSSLSSVLGIKGEREEGGESVLSHVNLTSPKKRQSFLILINVHSEFLNEQSKFSETIQLVEFAAACLGEPLLSLPPDLLFRYGTACAFQGKGSVYETPCRQVFQHLLQTCTMRDYGDVLLDAAANLCKAGMTELSEEIYDVFVRYYTMEWHERKRELESKKIELDAAQEEKRGEGTLSTSTRTVWRPPEWQGVGGGNHSPELSFMGLLEEVQELEKECKNLQVILAEAFYGLAQCHAAHEDFFDVEEPASFAKKALEVYPSHLQARLLLGKHYFYDKENLLAAVQILTPQPDEPALQRIQLGAVLVAIFRASKKYLEAIALGVSIFNFILSTPDDGDTESVAPGSYAASRRSLALKLPTLSRASSAIVPASSLSGMVRGHESSGGALSSRHGGSAGDGSASFLSASLASSIRAGSVVFRQQLSRRGHSALTTTVYGTSAAQSVAAGWDPKMEEEKLKDSSTIFQFHRKRHRPEKQKKEQSDNDKVNQQKDSQMKEGGSGGTQRKEMGDGAADEEKKAQKEEKEEEESLQERRQRRRVEVANMPASAFWPEDAVTLDQHADNGHKTSNRTEAKEEEEEEGGLCKMDSTKGVVEGGHGGRKDKEGEADEGKESNTKDGSFSHCKKEKNSLTVTLTKENESKVEEKEVGLVGQATTTPAVTETAMEPKLKTKLKERRGMKQKDKTRKKKKGEETEEEKEQQQRKEGVNAGALSACGSEMLEDTVEELLEELDDGEKVDDALPSLEEVSQQFEDKEMAQLFLAATMGTWEGMHPGRSEIEKEKNAPGRSKLDRVGDKERMEVEGNRKEPEDSGKEFDGFPFPSPGGGGAVSLATIQSLKLQAHLQKQSAEEAAEQQAVATVSAKEVVQVLGRHECMELARNIMECYRALGRFSEAKEFAALVLARFSGKRQSPHHRHSLERPLRLALLRSSLAAGEAEDAFRVGLRLLQDDTSPEETEEVLKLLHGVLNRTEDRSQLLFRHVFEGNDSPALLTLLANRYFQTRSYCRALNLYLAVYSKRPTDLLVVFMIGLLYFLCSHQKHVKNSEACVTAGIYFFSLYQDRTIALLSPHQRDRYGEVVYNTARVLQMLQQPSLCVPLYERVGYHLRVPEECTLAVQRAARFNLYFLYRWRSENVTLAIQSLLKAPSYH